MDKDSKSAAPERPQNVFLQDRRIAAVAPGTCNDEPPVLDATDRDLDAFCEGWVAWCRSRRLYGPPAARGSVLGRLVGGSVRPLRVEPEASCSADFAAFHVAYTCQPVAIDRDVFDCYYITRAKPIKVAAHALGIGRSHFYQLLGTFRRRVFVASRAILDSNLAAREFIHRVPGAWSASDRCAEAD